MDQHGPAEDRDEVVPEGAGRRGFQGGDVHLVDQVAEEGRLGEDLDVEEVGRRLERDRRQLVEPVQAAGRVDVEDRHGEDQPPRQAGDAAEQAGDQPGAAAADDVVAMVERRQERPEVGVGPRLLGRRDQDDGGRGPVQAHLQGLLLAAARDRDDVHLGRPPAPRQQVAQARGDGLGAGGIAVVEHDRPD
jgi:hypothetical protein